FFIGIQRTLTTAPTPWGTDQSMTWLASRTANRTANVSKCSAVCSLPLLVSPRLKPANEAEPLAASHPRFAAWSGGTLGSWLPLPPRRRPDRAVFYF
ncbi:hypothetical protein CH063_12641, partial [Colletotrichum higginsianum]